MTQKYVKTDIYQIMYSANYIYELIKYSQLYSNKSNFLDHLFGYLRYRYEVCNVTGQRDLPLPKERIERH